MPTERDYRAQHGKVVEAPAIGTEAEPAHAGMRMRRVQAPVERYAARDLLTKRQVDAAMDLRADWEFGICGVRDGDRYSGTRSGLGLTDGQIDAATAYRHAVQSIGKSASAIVLPVVIGDAAGGEITVETLAARRSEDRKQVMGMLKLGLDSLADHYASCSNRQRAAKYA